MVYEGNDKTAIVRQQEGGRGYAVGFIRLLEWIEGQLPANEAIVKAVREEAKMFPGLALRELVANASIHQDFSVKGASVTIEIYKNRIEITNPGIPEIALDRFIDENQSRNEKLAYTMRKLRLCEELGSGIDKVLMLVELWQLSPPIWEARGNSVRVVLFGHKPFSKMAPADRIRACYQHCCLRYITGQVTNNKSLRERFKLSDKFSSQVGAVIDACEKENLIKVGEQGKTSTRYRTYVPHWA